MQFINDLRGIASTVLLIVIITICIGILVTIVVNVLLLERQGNNIVAVALNLRLSAEEVLDLLIIRYAQPVQSMVYSRQLKTNL